MSEYLLYGFAQSGNCYKPARIRTEPRWKHPYELLPDHPIPDRKQAAR
jgi:hypothetical protein